ncbi:hypothetical protein [Rahnella sp. CG8]|nr:hypothetical protein [Rahnella sp. CG8]
MPVKAVSAWAMRCGLVGAWVDTHGSLEPWLLAGADESAKPGQE